MACSDDFSSYVFDTALTENNHRSVHSNRRFLSAQSNDSHIICFGILHRGGLPLAQSEKLGQNSLVTVFNEHSNNSTQLNSTQLTS